MSLLETPSHALIIGGAHDGTVVESFREFVQMPLCTVKSFDPSVLRADAFSFQKVTYRRESVAADWTVFYPPNEFFPEGVSRRERFMDYRFFVPESSPVPYRADDKTIRRLTAHFHGVRWK